ncbi:hypothetical protein DOK78_001682 [Enterococcus sp. DIV2402]|uniref:Integral membrane protein n=1 Tax=Candidatus Enterococcus lowellii TaxID=2230877 RepID=A0ABZ2SSZ6_9ENTE|nr:hypothetical protein [Enterococcus sp. DIV2402]MBO0464131.1 hypothetical protein [Enterococcus sp. DIV2402]
MLISGTLWIIFSFLLLVTNQIYSELFYHAPHPLIVMLAVLALMIGIFFYYEYYSGKKKNEL